MIATLAAALLASGSSSCSAATSSTPPPVAAQPGGLGAALKGLGFELEINNDKPEAGVSFGGRLPPCITTQDDGTARFGQWSWNAGFTAPFGGKDDLSDPQTLDKLSNGSTLSFGLSHFGFANRDSGSVPTLTPGAQYGLEAEIGFNTFDYRDSGTLAEHADDETQYALKAFAAYYPAWGRSMVAGSVKYQDAYEAQDETIVCKSVVVSPADDCVKAAPGRPNRDRGVVFGLEYRQTLLLPHGFGDLAFSPNVSLEADGDDYGLELPVYLVLGGDASILPGFKVGYSSEKDETTFGVFLKSSFSLAP